jgi:hypothetical protein
MTTPAFSTRLTSFGTLAELAPEAGVHMRSSRAAGNARAIRSRFLFLLFVITASFVTRAKFECLSAARDETAENAGLTTVGLGKTPGRNYY